MKTLEQMIQEIAQLQRIITNAVETIAVLESNTNMEEVLNLMEYAVNGVVGVALRRAAAAWKIEEARNE